MGETHPAEKKIVVEFCTRDLPGLTYKERIKLIKLVGPRYNPETDVVKMSCEMFETQAQNKRYLGDLVDSLMAEAKDKSDMFQDVPLDFRHHKFRRKITFPETWKLTPEKKKELDMEREQKSLSERERELRGQVVDGGEAIENWLKTAALSAPSAKLAGGQTDIRRRGGQRGGSQRQNFRG
jgi:small subunit ribosomal protein S35